MTWLLIDPVDGAQDFRRHLASGTNCNNISPSGVIDVGNVVSESSPLMLSAVFNDRAPLRDYQFVTSGAEKFSYISKTVAERAGFPVLKFTYNYFGEHVPLMAMEHKKVIAFCVDLEEVYSRNSPRVKFCLEGGQADSLGLTVAWMKRSQTAYTSRNFARKERCRAKFCVAYRRVYDFDMRMLTVNSVEKATVSIVRFERQNGPSVFCKPRQRGAVMCANVNHLANGPKTMKGGMDKRNFVEALAVDHILRMPHHTLPEHPDDFSLHVNHDAYLHYRDAACKRWPIVPQLAVS